MKLGKFIKRYKIDWVNPNIRFSRFEYVLIYIDKDITYSQALELLKGSKLHAATMEELLEWEDWDGVKQVLACGSLYEVNGEKYVPCLHCETVYEPDKHGDQRRLALLNTNIKWLKDIYLLGVREV